MKLSRDLNECIRVDVEQLPASFPLHHVLGDFQGQHDPLHEQLGDAFDGVDTSFKWG